jgi:hypothetical protein
MDLRTSGFRRFLFRSLNLDRVPDEAFLKTDCVIDLTVVARNADG